MIPGGASNRSESSYGDRATTGSSHDRGRRERPRSVGRTRAAALPRVARSFLRRPQQARDDDRAPPSPTRRSRVAPTGRAGRTGRGPQEVDPRDRSPPACQVRDDREHRCDHEPARNGREGQGRPLGDGRPDHRVGRQVVRVEPDAERRTGSARVAAAAATSAISRVRFPSASLCVAILEPAPGRRRREQHEAAVDVGAQRGEDGQRARAARDAACSASRPRDPPRRTAGRGVCGRIASARARRRRSRDARSGRSAALAPVRGRPGTTSAERDSH